MKYPYTPFQVAGAGGTQRRGAGRRFTSRTLLTPPPLPQQLFVLYERARNLLSLAPLRRTPGLLTCCLSLKIALPDSRLLALAAHNAVIPVDDLLPTFKTVFRFFFHQKNQKKSKLQIQIIFKMSQTKSNFKKSTQQKGNIRDQCNETVRMGVVSKRPKKISSGRLWDLSFLAIFGQKSSFASRYF